MDEQAKHERRPPWLLGFEGPDPSDDFLRLIERHPPAGLILFRDNLPRGGLSIRPVKRRLEQAAGRPLPVFLDEEGGWIQASGGRPAWPSPRALAMAGPDNVERMHKAMARRCAGFGASVLLAPLADLDDGSLNPVIGTRSFGPRSEESSRAVQASIDGLRAGGVIPVVKHFPGHGDSLEDSHLTLPVVAEERGEALTPFWRAIRLKVPGLMTAHLRLGERPEAVTYRRDIVTDLLQEEMGYGGLVMTDALEMQGARSLPLERQGAAALRAGHHLLTLARWHPRLDPLLDGVLEEADSLAPLFREAWKRWDRFIVQAVDPAPEPWSEEEIENRLIDIRRGALFRPDGGRAAALGLKRIALEFGPLGSWAREDYMRELARYPLRLLDSVSKLKTSEAYLYIGRCAPPPPRIEELRARATLGSTPPVLVAGPWGWIGRRFPQQLATQDSSPPGVREMLALARAPRETPP